MGVIFFIYNAAFSLILLIMVLVSSIYAFVSKNPDTRYQPMRDDRGSFIKSQTQLGNGELDALGATARGDSKHGMAPFNKSRSAIDDDDDSSLSSGSGGQMMQMQHLKQPGQQVREAGARSPVNNSVPLFPTGAPPSYNSPQRSVNNSPAPGSRGNQFRQQNNASPWQRGAGYE